MTLILHQHIKQFFSDDKDLFDQIMQIKGTRYRSLQNRETLKFTLNGQHYFIKKHFGLGWKEIFKSLLKGKLPTISAESEVRAIHHLQQIGISVPTVVGFGVRGINPATRKSFIIMESLENKMSVNELLLTWKKSKVDFYLKKTLTLRIAEIVSSMHLSGLNHRDCYLVHFLIDKTNIQDCDTFPIYVIDLHRAQIRQKTPRRWIIKDLTGLYFSSMNIQLSRNDCFRFMKAYSGKTLREIFLSDLGFWLSIKRRAKKLFLKRAIQ